MKMGRRAHFYMIVRLYIIEEIMHMNISIYLSVVAAALAALVSTAGIMSDATYAKETANWAAQGAGQDVVTLIVVVPALLATAWYTKRGSVRAFLVWMGLLLYLVYSYILYAFFIHFGVWFPVYVAILGLAFYAFVGGVIHANVYKLGERLIAIKGRAASIFLMTISGLFYALWMADIVGALARQKAPQSLADTGLSVNPVQVLDLALLLPAAAIVAVLVWRKKALGMMFALPLLTFFAVMGLAIIAIMAMTAYEGFPLAVPPIIMMSMVIVVAAILGGRFANATKGWELRG